MRRQILIALSALLVLPGFTISPPSQEPNINITGKVNDTLYQDGMVAYLFIPDGNDLLLADTCIVGNDAEHALSLTGYIPRSEGSPRVLLSPANTERGIGEYWLLYISQGESININFNGQDNSKIDVSGSPSLKQSIERSNIKMITGNRIRSLQKELFKNKDSLEHTRIQHEIDSLTHYCMVEINAKYIHNCISPEAAYTTLGGLRIYGVDDSFIDSLLVVARRRFPDNLKLQMYPKSPYSYPQETEQSKIVRRKYNKLTVGVEDPYSAPDKIYKEGDVVDDFLLEAFGGGVINLYSLTTDYVLIDFWADWCVPCKHEMPNVIATDNEFDNLSVLAVSIDFNRDTWQQAVETLGMTSLHNVYLPGQTMNMLAKRFQIRSIPANFLLDREHRIIATNLRGDDLKKKMEELQEK